jgi:hypothetical protein
MKKENRVDAEFPATFVFVKVPVGVEADAVAARIVAG